MIQWIDTQKKLPPDGLTVLLYWNGGETLKPILYSGRIMYDADEPYWYANGRHYHLTYAPYWAHINAPENEQINSTADRLTHLFRLVPKHRQHAFTLFAVYVSELSEAGMDEAMCLVRLLTEIPRFCKDTINNATVEGEGKNE